MTPSLAGFFYLNDPTFIALGTEWPGFLLGLCTEWPHILESTHFTW